MFPFRLEAPFLEWVNKCPLSREIAEHIQKTLNNFDDASLNKIFDQYNSHPLDKAISNLLNQVWKDENPLEVKGLLESSAEKILNPRKVKPDSEVFMFHIVALEYAADNLGGGKVG
jgi:hypothetical protein